MNKNNNYSDIKKIFNKEIGIIENKIISSVKTRQPLNDSIIKFLIAPQKRIRSVISMLIVKALYEEEISDLQLDYLSAIELIHSASLIHDDIIDESETRRGNKTIHCEFGTKMGIISGDYLLAIALEKLTKINSKNILEVITETFKNMCTGEISQNFDRYKIGTIEQYIEKTRNKTAYLFETAIYGTVLLGNKPFEATKIKNFGQNIGIAFQIQDDLKNFLAYDSLKPVQNDVESGIYTAPVIFSKNLEEGIAKTRILLNNYVMQAEILLEFLPDNAYKYLIEEFLELLRYE